MNRRTFLTTAAMTPMLASAFDSDTRADDERASVVTSALTRIARPGAKASTGGGSTRRQARSRRWGSPPRLIVPAGSSSIPTNDVCTPRMNFRRRKPAGRPAR